MQPYYQTETMTLYHGRCEDVMPTLEAASFDAVICDPPYGTTACAWDSPIPFDAMWRELRRLVKPRAPIVLFGSQPFTAALIMSNVKWFKYEWVWQKNRSQNFLVSHWQPHKRHENILVFGEGQTRFNPIKHFVKPYSVNGSRPKLVKGAKTGRQVSSSPPVSSDGWQNPISIVQFDSVYGTIHPTQKPLLLMEYLVKTYTTEGARVLDFTCGSGTTLRACKNLKRACVGIEQDEGYCKVTVDRLEPQFEAALVADAVEDYGPLFR